MKDELSPADVFRFLAPLKNLTGLGKITQNRHSLNAFNTDSKEIPVADFFSDSNHAKKYFVINGHPITASFTTERKPETYNRIRSILLSPGITASYKEADAP